MPNVNELRKFLKVDMVKTGDLIHFCDAGIIGPKTFKQDGKDKTETMLEMDVMVNDSMKPIKYSPNATSCGLLSDAWGKNTEEWVGESGQVLIVEQLSFGKLTNVLLVKPLTHTNKRALTAQQEQEQVQ